VDLLVDQLHRVGANRDASEFKTGHFALKAPGIAVDVENPMAEEVAEDGGEGFPFGVVVEIGLENVLDVVGVGGYGVPQDMHMDGARWGLPEKVGVPVAEVGVLLGPAHGHVALAEVAVTPWLHPGDENQEREERKEEGEGEEEEAAGSRH